MCNRTGIIGRFLRIAVSILLLFGDLLIAVQASGSLLLSAVIVLVGITVIYLGIHLLVSWVEDQLNPWLGAALANVPVIIVFTLGVTGIPFVGNGAGQLAATFYVGFSLLVAGIRADLGCEVMAFPNLALRGETNLACLAFSPIEWLEERLRT